MSAVQEAEAAGIDHGMSALVSLRRNGGDKHQQEWIPMVGM